MKVPVPVPVPLNRQTACDDRFRAGPLREGGQPPGFGGVGPGPSGSGGALLHFTNLPDTCIFRQQFHLVNRDLVQLHQPFLLGKIFADKEGIKVF